MNWKSFSVLVLLALVLVGGILALRGVRRPDTVTFVVTGDTQGFLVPCGCATTPSGGLARRESVIRRARGSQESGQVVPVELGHGFADRGPGKDLLNAAMGEFFDRNSYLVGLNSQDLAQGEETLKRHVRTAPLLLAGDPGRQGWVDYRLGGWGVGPVGDQGAVLRVLFLAETAPGGTLMDPPLEVFKRAEASGGADAYILFGNLSPNALSAIVKAEPRVLAAVAWWRFFVTPTPQRAGQTWMVFNGDRGRRFTAVKVVRVGDRWEVFPESAHLGPEVPSDPAVQAGAEAVLAQVDAANRAALQAGRVPLGEARAWSGSEACKPCHAKAYDIWAASRHARATKELEVDHQQGNPDCLVCHATGVGKPGGYPDGPASLASVGCEACHGPAGGHPASGPRLQRASTEACAGCHGPRDSPDFDPASAWELIRHGL